MKRRKLFTLVLALMMVLAAMALSASAVFDDEEITPTGIVCACSNCHSERTMVETKELPSNINATIKCSECGKDHKYEGINVYDGVICLDCGEEDWKFVDLRYDLYCKNPG